MEKQLLTKELVMFHLKAETKEDVIQAIAEAMEQDGRLENKEGYIADVLKREASSSTAVGFDTATPHAKSEYVKEPSLAFVRLAHPISWDGKEEVSMVFQIGVPAVGHGDRHLEILASLFRQLVHDDFREKLLAAENESEIVEIMKSFQ